MCNVKSVFLPVRLPLIRSCKSWSRWKILKLAYRKVLYVVHSNEQHFLKVLRWNGTCWWILRLPIERSKTKTLATEFIVQDTTCINVSKPIVEVKLSQKSWKEREFAFTVLILITWSLIVGLGNIRPQIPNLKTLLVQSVPDLFATDSSYIGNALKSLSRRITPPSAGLSGRSDWI